MQAETQRRRGGLVLVDALLAHGIDHVFLVPGESFLDVIDALYQRRAQIRTITCRFEAGAVHMAEAYGKLTGRLAAAMVTRGPGACHAAIGVHVAQQDSTPLLLFVGQIPFAETDRESFQEVDYRRFFGPIAKWVTQIDDARRIPELVAHAADVALSGRPGPVVVALSEEMQREMVEVADRPPVPVAVPQPDPAALHRMLELLGRAERPLAILGGAHWSAPGLAAMRAWLVAHDLPVAVAFRRQSLFDGHAPQYAGDLGVGADPALVAAVREADLVLAIGSRLGEAVSQGYTLWPRDAALNLVHVYPDAAEIGRVWRPALGIASDLNAFAAALAALPKVPPRWRDWTREVRGRREAGRMVPDYQGRLNLGRVLQQLEGVLEPDAILTSDAGNFATFVTRFMHLGARQAYLAPTNGAMGYGVPAAIGAAIAFPRHQVVGFVGDGGFMMTGQDLATALQYGAAPIILVFNNGMYGTIRMHQENHFPGRVNATSLLNPDFAALAQAYGAHGELVEEDAAFLPAWERARASGRAAIIELSTDAEQITSRARIEDLRRAALARGAGG